MAKNKKEYKFYACYKNSKGSGACGHGRDTCEEAYRDIQRYHVYVQNDIIFIGVIKCKDDAPLSHIQNL